MNSLEELLELTEILEKESKDININDISQVISFLKKYIDCQNKIINAFKENYDKKTIKLSKYEQALDILKDKFKFELGVSVVKEKYCYSLEFLFNNQYFSITKEEYELLKEVLK